MAEAGRAGPLGPPHQGQDRNWPTEAEEAAYIAAEGAPALEPAIPAIAPPPEKEMLPAVETLVPQIPAALRETLDELFRARFTRVIKS
jgi:hypothetical protein